VVGGSLEVLRCVVLGGYEDGEGLLGCYEDVCGFNTVGLVRCCGGGV
jgi:hypothetical protein